MAFPTLFPFGKGSYGSLGTDIRFQRYVMHLLRQFTGNFLKHTGWLAYVVRITALIRAVRGEERPRSELTGERDIASFKDFMESLPQTAFFFRYLVGDSDAYNLMVMYIDDMQKELERDRLRGR